MLYSRITQVATLVFALCVPACGGIGDSVSAPPGCDAGSGGSGGSGNPQDAGVVYPDPDPADCGDLAQYDTSPWSDPTGAPVPLGSFLRAGGTIETSIYPAAGQRIKELRARIIPRHHDSLSGESLPYFDFHRLVEDGDALVARAWDPYAVVGDTWNPSPANAAGYSSIHDIVLTVFETIADGTHYVVALAGEWGGGEAQDVIVCGMIVTVDQ